MTTPRALFYRPAPPLCDLVDAFWFYEAQSLPHAKERVLPHGAMDLIINLKQNQMRVYDAGQPEHFQTFDAALLCGMYSSPFVIDTTCQESVMGVGFKPGGAFPFFRPPADELRDTHVSLDALWGASARDLRDRLLEAATTQAKFRVLEHALLTQMNRRVSPHPAVTFAIQAFACGPGAQTITAMTTQIGLSARRFSQVFSQEVGLTPKLFCRVKRFQESLDQIESGKQVDWADLALACGYFDQAHFIHDFQTFSGINPTTYVAQPRPHRNHIPLSA